MFGHLYLFVTTLLLSLIFILLGSILLILPWFQGFKEMIVAVIEDSQITLSLFGAAFLVLGISLLAHQLLSLRRRPYFIKSGPLSISIDPQILEKTLQTFCQERFPTQTVLVQSRINNRQITIGLCLPKMAIERQKPLLQQLESELTDLLAKLFGYRKSFELVATFGE